MKPIYKTNQTRTEVMTITQIFREQIDDKIKDHYLETSHGKTYVMELGDRTLPTVVVMHGGMTNHAFIMYFLRRLIGKFNIICPDVPGHPGFSSEVPLDPRGNDHGDWLVETLDQLGIESANFVGTSYGGFVVSRLIAVAPTRVNRVAYIVPAGFVNMSAFSFAKNFLLWHALFTLTKTDFFFQKILGALFTDWNDKNVERFFKLTITGMRIDTRQMKISTQEECDRFHGPVFVLSADGDVIFDCNSLKKGVGELYPQAKFEVLPNSKHSPSIEIPNINALNNRIVEFLLA